jgi:hypothetical protein
MGKKMMPLQCTNHAEDVPTMLKKPNPVFEYHTNSIG